MIKKGLVFGLIAVLSAVLLFTGCNTGTGSTESPVTVAPDGMVVDRTVNSEPALVSALDDPNVDVVAFVFGSTDLTASGGIIIPAGKTVYLLNPNTEVRTLTPAAAGLEVRGNLIVSESTRLAAGSNAKVYLGNSGSIQIQAGGKLRTDKRTSVSNLTDAGVGVASVLGNVRYAGGSDLTITAEPDLTVTQIGEILGYITAGPARSANISLTAPSSLTLEAALTQVKPSDIAGVPGISAARTLAVTPVAVETESSITIPPGAVVTITQELPTVKTLVVEGSVSAPSVGNGTDAVTVSKGAALTVETAIKFAAESKIVSGGSFSGSAAEGANIPADPGATVNGTTVKEEETIVVVTDTLPTTFEAKTYQIKGTITVSSAITVPAGTTLLIPEGATLTIDSTGSIAEASEGTIILEGGTATGMPVLDTTANYNPSGLTIASAEKNLKSGGITVKLGGTVSGGIPTAQNSMWGNGGSSVPVGNWSAAVIVGILDTEALKANTVIKQTNQALRYYQGSSADILTVEPNPANPPTTGPNIYIDSAKAYKLKKYTSANGAADGSNSGFGVLLWSGANPKTATIEITPATTDSDYTVIVDWNGVTINQ
ncbi:MAG: hypothetical protein LBG08_00050 [Spirochaetaceae bacterium]|jgi:hypothetical protein|nr:hypothetical protein [Spirochaetaceae bacterium]